VVVSALYRVVLVIEAVVAGGVALVEWSWTATGCFWKFLESSTLQAGSGAGSLITALTRHLEHL
jgi:hypothetical protein